MTDTVKMEPMRTDSRNKKRLKHRISTFDVVLTIIFTIIALITFYPFYHVIILSFSNTVSVATHTPYVLPYAFDLTGYRTVFQDPSFVKSLMVTLFVTIVGTIINMLLSVTGAYVLSRRKLIGRKFFLGLILFTMLFSGGLVPTYLNIKNLGLINSIWSMILPSAISTYYLVIMKNYFMELPESLLEAARIDGANELGTLIKIVLPISMPFMATFTLFYAVERWNEWYNALLYISDTSKEPLQIYLRNMLVSMSNQLTTQAQLLAGKSAPIQAVQMAAIMIAAVPILCVYPFVQKYYVQGITAGSIKE